jgi:hypothetical protein
LPRSACCSTGFIVGQVLAINPAHAVRGLPVDGQLITASVGVPSEKPEVVKKMDYEARELAEVAADD